MLEAIAGTRSFDHMISAMGKVPKLRKMVALINSQDLRDAAVSKLREELAAAASEAEATAGPGQLESDAIDCAAGVPTVSSTQSGSNDDDFGELDSMVDGIPTMDEAMAQG